MKNAQKFTLKLFITFFILFGIIGCGGCEPEKDDIVISPDDVKDIIISDDQARTRFENYREHRRNIIEFYENNGRSLVDSIPQKGQYDQDEKRDKEIMSSDEKKGFVPVQYTYYNYKEFKKYLDFIEQETEKAGADISTMRIYFANYPENDSDRDKQKRNTVMFVPTINVDGNESAYYISDAGADGLSPFLLSDSLSRTEKQVPPDNLKAPENTDKANLLPSLGSYLRPSQSREQSVIGNEGGRNPPSH